MAYADDDRYSLRQVYWRKSPKMIRDEWIPGQDFFRVRMSEDSLRNREWEIRDWIKENGKSYLGIKTSVDRKTSWIRFQNADEAMIFKLLWGGEIV